MIRNIIDRILYHIRYGYAIRIKDILVYPNRFTTDPYCRILSHDCEEWLKENMTGKYSWTMVDDGLYTEQTSKRHFRLFSNDAIFHFSKKSDAMLFKLTWL
jgi:hypothetical protein